MTEQEVIQVINDHAIKGVRFNVVRRPLSGGKGSIVRHKPTKSNPAGESKEEYYARLGGLISADPDYYFMRWTAAVTTTDVERFRRRFLDPVLEELCRWYEAVETCPDSRTLFDWGAGVHFQFPFGVPNYLMDGGHSDLDEYVNSGSTVGLRRVETLFNELQ